MTETEEEAPAGWGAILSGANAGRAAVLAGGVALHATYVFIVATILPSAVGEIGGVAYYAWTTTLFAVGSIVGASSAARLLERRGPRAAYFFATSVFAAGSVLCALSPVMAVLIVGRTLQGTGGGMLAALGYAVVATLFPDRLRSRAIGLISGVWGAAALAGPFLGGGLAQIGFWRGAFWCALPLCLGCVLLARRFLPKAGAADIAPGQPFPALRLGLLAAAAFSVSAGSVPGRIDTALAGLLVGLPLLLLMLRLDNRATRRMLPEGALQPGTPIGSVVRTMALVAVCMGTSSFVPYILHLARGLPPLEAGYLAALSSVAWTVAAFVAGGAGPVGARRWMSAGPLTIAAGLVTVAAAMTTDAPTAVIAAGWAMVGGGIGMGWVHYAAFLIGSVEAPQRAVAATFVTTLQVSTLAFSSALAGVVANLAGLPAATTPEGVLAAGCRLFATFALFPLCAFIAARRMLAVGGRPPAKAAI